MGKVKYHIDLKEKLVKEHAAGESWAEISKRTGIPQSTVASFARKKKKINGKSPVIIVQDTVKDRYIISIDFNSCKEVLIDMEKIAIIQDRTLEEQIRHTCRTFSETTN